MAKKGEKETKRTHPSNGRELRPAVDHRTVPVGALIRQNHGGALRHGGTNRGGPGRPPSAIRTTALRDLDIALPELLRIVQMEKASNADKIRAIDVLGKIGLDRHVSVADLLAALAEQSALIWELLPREMAETLQLQLRPIWLKLYR